MEAYLILAALLLLSLLVVFLIMRTYHLEKKVVVTRKTYLRKGGRVVPATPEDLVEIEKMSKQAQEMLKEAEILLHKAQEELDEITDHGK